MRLLTLSVVLLCGCSAPIDATGGGGGGDSAGGGSPAMGGGSATGGGSAAGGGSSTGGGSTDAGFTPAAHRAFPIIPHGNGRPLKPLKLVTLTASNDPNAATWQQFGDAAVASSWFSAVTAEYDAGTSVAPVHVTLPAITADVTEDQLTAMIQTAITGGSAPAPDGNTLYLVYLPAPHVVTDSSFCAYHLSWQRPDLTYGGDGWGVVAQCEPFYGETAVQANTRVASHELIEAVTDSLYGYSLGQTPLAPWLDSAFRSYESYGEVEVADLCEGTRIFEGSWDYQRSWSNAHAAAGDDPCVPANPGGYFNVSVERDWYAADAGTTVTIPFTGWSTVARGPWLMEDPYLINGTPVLANDAADGGLWSLSTALGDIALGSGCYTFPGMNNGASGTLTVHMPLRAARHDWVVIGLSSFDEDPATCYGLTDRDAYHFWPVGVYVP